MSKSAGKRPTKRKFFKVWLRLHAKGIDSWTKVYENLYIGMQRLNIDVYRSVLAEPPPSDAKERVEIWWGDPCFWKVSTKSRLRVGLTLSEHTSMAQEGYGNWLKSMRNCDVVFAPNHTSAVGLYQAPFDAPIHEWPLGVDEVEYPYIRRNFESSPFTFLLLGVAQFRKGTWLAVDAFLKAFKVDEDVKLLVSAFKVSRMSATLVKEFSAHPQIEISTKNLPDDRVVSDVLGSSHVLVSAQLAEGWGLCIPEAMATGMPCIVARCSAPVEYFDSRYGWWCEMSEQYLPVAQCLLNTNGFWRVPDVNDLAKKMRYAFDHREECSKKGRVASEYARSNLRWTDGIVKGLSTLKRYLS